MVAIGGINQQTIAEVAHAGVRCFAIVSALVGAPDIPAQAAKLRNFYSRKVFMSNNAHMVPPQAKAPPVVLSIAGSDSGGGAGIQGDIKTISALGGFAVTVITALTAQNGAGVSGVQITPPDFVLQQLAAVHQRFADLSRQNRHAGNA